MEDSARMLRAVCRILEQTSRCAATRRLGRRGASRRRLARDEWAEGVPSFAPFAFALPELCFQVSEVIGEAFYFV